MRNFKGKNTEVGAGAGLVNSEVGSADVGSAGRGQAHGVVHGGLVKELHEEVLVARLLPVGNAGSFSFSDSDHIGVLFVAFKEGLDLLHQEVPRVQPNAPLQFLRIRKLKNKSKFLRGLRGSGPKCRCSEKSQSPSKCS